MKKISTIVIGLSLLTSTALFASGDHMGDHMHNGKMANHMNPGGKTDKEMNKMGMSPYHHNMMVNGYDVTVASDKPLSDGKNHMSVMLMKNGHPINDANMSMKFSMPSMPGMEFMEQASFNNDKYNTNVNFSMGGQWDYELIFKTSDGVINKVNGSVNIK